MSASLVGSEMCIRDRHFAEQRATHRTRTAAIPGNLARQKLSHRATMEPVSYTHLTLPTICSV
eukprot:7437364-Alexandrium_andersonii.AAC.1